MKQIILASGSEIRHRLLKNASVSHTVIPSVVDEMAILKSALEQGIGLKEIAAELAREKARAVASPNTGSMVIGCDQILEHQGNLISKAQNKAEALQCIEMLSGDRHRLISAVSVFENGEQVWNHVGVAELEMRELSTDHIDRYIDHNWAEIRHCVGCYMLEKEGAWLFSEIKGDYFTVLGLPLIQLLGYLSGRGVCPE